MPTIKFNKDERLEAMVRTSKAMKADNKRRSPDNARSYPINLRYYLYHKARW